MEVFACHAKLASKGGGRSVATGSLIGLGRGFSNQPGQIKKGVKNEREGGKEGRRVGGKEGRRAGGQEGRRAGGQEGRRAGGQEGRRAGGQKGWQEGKRGGGKEGREAAPKKSFIFTCDGCNTWQCCRTWTCLSLKREPAGTSHVGGGFFGGFPGCWTLTVWGRSIHCF